MSQLGDWMVDTFVYTSLLIALVLLVRRPVSRICGPGVAYALWALPLLRFILPPIVLPAWMAPAPTVEAASRAGEPLMVIISEPGQASVADTAAAMPAVGIEVSDLLLPLWLVGAALFIAWRVREYRQMRARMLADAIPVGEAGRIRLVETPAVGSPVAFGVFDKVVALPPDFMGHYDLAARDMALAHELAHHRGHDLVANIAAQPLLALHWFNPLAWWGWRAMRRDQEAACDARVVAGRAQSERAAYAQVIAGFAAGERLGLAAPMAGTMACPMLGEKSIIHRLRSLTMSEVSSRRRRIGIAAITTTALALPLTASITYAQAEAPTAPVDEQVIETVDPDTGERRVRIERRVHADGEEHADGEHEMHVIRLHGDEAEDGEHRVVHRRIIRNGEELDEAQIEEMMARLEADMEGREEEIRIVVERAMEHTENAREMSEHAREMGEHARTLAMRAPQVSMDCEGVGPSGVAERELADGRRAIVICQRFINESAVSGLREAMRELRNNSELSDEVREEALREMQRAIEELQREERHVRRVQAKLEAAPLAPNVRAQAVAMRWQGRMVSPVAPVPPVVPAAYIVPVAPVPPTPLSNADCDEGSARA